MLRIGNLNLLIGLMDRLVIIRLWLIGWRWWRSLIALLIGCVLAVRVLLIGLLVWRICCLLRQRLHERPNISGLGLLEIGLGCELAYNGTIVDARAGVLGTHWSYAMHRPIVPV